MKILETIGIDISKLCIDVRIYSNQAYRQFENSKKGFRQMLKWSYKNSPFSEEKTLIVFEHTGLYSHSLAVFLTEENIPFSMVPGLEIKRSLGIARGKDDKVDALKIAKYAYRLRDEIKLYELPSEKIMSLKRLLTLRERLVKQRAGFKVSLKEIKRVLVKKDNKILFETEERMIKRLSKEIDQVEKEMDGIIKSDDNLKEMYDLIVSIKSVGPQTAKFMIAYTAAFTKFIDARKFASYCGTAPFPNCSGTSIRGKTKVSNLANKKIKSLLDQCAKNAIQYNYEMKEYYERRTEQGKQEMSTINIIRNKLLARIFAVIKRGTPYVDMKKYAA